MKLTLNVMILKTVLPVFGIAVLFFVLILQLIDLFEHIPRYMDLEVPFPMVLRVQLLYLPRSIHFSLPMGLLFAVAFSLGTLYSQNELIAVFGSGISLSSFVAPVVVLGVILSAGSFLFEEHLVIDSYTQKNALQDEILNITRSQSDSNVTRLGRGSRLLYHAEYFNAANETLSQAVFVRRAPDGSIEQLIHAESAVWNGVAWEARSVRIFDWIDDAEDQRFEESFVQSVVLDEFMLSPDSFRRVAREIEQMRLIDARAYIESQRSSGLPFREELTQYHERYSFAFTPLIVVLIATAIGGRFRKNILLMSLLISLSVSVVYYVVQFLSGLLARSGMVSPLFGAWSGVLLFLAAGVVLLRYSRT